MLYLIVFLGAGIGGALRHGVNVGAVKLFGFGFPFGTLIVNIVGSFAIGLFAGYFAFRPGIGQHMRLFLTTGLLGGFTTFSAYGLQTFELLREGRVGVAALNVVASNLLGLLMVFAGYASAKLVGGA